MERIFKRKIYQQLLNWKQTENGRTAVLVEGARRIGKSTIVEQFAKQEYESYILIDFNKAGKETIALWNDLNNLDAIFIKLQQTYQVVLHKRKSVIIFDEVQNCPKARQAIKYLVQDGRYDYIETGSLISIRKNTKDITIPSEEDRITMYPMDFEEFRWALGDTATFPLLRQQFELRMSLGDAAARLKMRDIRLYMLVGGMPQAVNTYLDTNNLSLVDKTKRGIIKLYLEDFQKVDATGNAERLFKNIPAQLSVNASRYQPYTVIEQQTESKMAELLQDLEQSKTVLFCHHCTDPNVGMSLNKDLRRYKLFLADTGLFVTLCFWDKRYTDNVIYNKLLSDKLEANLGYVYENLVAQMLAAAGNELFYHTFPKDEKHNYEIDFLLSNGNKICPIEVKSSGYKTHASLDAFCKKYSSRIAERYLVYTKDLRFDAETVMLPVYMLPFINNQTNEIKGML
ncbi:MAG: ATP-binding protein [Bacteroidales bacterium]|nr:ATP-binding protein [Bacteroidales bacterium]